MFMTKRAAILCQKLKDLGEGWLNSDETTLLRAYVTYVLQCANATEAITEDMFFRFPEPGLPESLSNEFASYEFGEFLTTIVPNVVGDCQRIRRMLEERRLASSTTDFKHLANLSKDTVKTMAISFAILFIKDFFQNLLADKETKSKITAELFVAYRKECRARKMPAIIEMIDFNDLVECTLLLRQDNSLTLLSSPASSNAYSAFGSLFSALKYSREEITSFLLDCYIPSGADIPKPTQIHFTRIDEDERKKITETIRGVLLDVPSPIEALAISESAIKPGAKNTFRPSDAPVELSLIANTFMAEAAGMASTKEECLIIFPSALFVMKWAENPYLTNKKVTFVIPSEQARQLLEETYNGESHRYTDRYYKFKFISLADWLQTIDQTKTIYATFVLVFENHIEDLKITGIAHQLQGIQNTLLDALLPNATLYAISPEKYLDKHLDGSESILRQCALHKNASFSIDEAVAIPRKGQKEDSPGFSSLNKAQKLFWRATSSKTDRLTKITFLRNDTRVIDALYCFRIEWQRNGRMLTQECAKSYVIDLADKASKHQGETLRSYCRKPHQPAKPRKDSRIPLRYSDEITLWYTVSLTSTKKHARRKLKVEVSARHFDRTSVAEETATAPPNTDEDEVIATRSRGKRGRGRNSIIEGSVVDFYLPEENATDQKYIEDFIINEYPRKKIIDTKAPENGTVKRYPREIVANVYKEELKGQNLSIRTLLFLHEELDITVVEANRGKPPILLHDILCPILDKHCDELDSDDFLNVLDETLPVRSATCFLRILKTLKNIINIANESEPGTRNMIDKLIDDESSFIRAVSKLRVALGKRHFSLDEFYRLYKAIVAKLDKKPIYYGVLIRLFTGLESNIVSSLCWNDYKHSPEYDYHYLIIYRQASGNGQKEDLDLQEDSAIRRLPLPLSLVQHLEKIRPKKKGKTNDKDLAEYNPDDTDDNPYADDETETGNNVEETKDKEITENKQEIRSASQIHIVKEENSSDGLSAVSPSKIDQAAKDIINKVFKDSPDISVIIPCDENDEGMEQSLARIRGGLIFRENMRYWLTRYCAFDIDQVSHFLGNSGVTTLGRHYVDYNCPESQYQTASKLWRLDALLKTYQNSPNPQAEIRFTQKGVSKVSGNDQYPYQIDLDISSEDAEEDVVVTVRSNHGLATCLTFTSSKEDGNG